MKAYFICHVLVSFFAWRFFGGASIVSHWMARRRDIDDWNHRSVSGPHLGRSGEWDASAASPVSSRQCLVGGSTLDEDAMFVDDDLFVQLSQWGGVVLFL